MNLDAKRILIFGATSAIASGVAARYAEAGSSFFLVARDDERTQHTAHWLKEKGAGAVAVYLTDLRIRESHDEILTKAKEHLGEIDIVIVAHGIMPDYDVVVNDVDVVMDTLLINTVSAISVTHRSADALAAQGHGSLVVISSVAGDRGRQSNAAYGASKAALTTYTNGLRGIKAESGIHILTVKPGPVRTPLVGDRKVPLMTTVDVVATDIIHAIERKRLVLYTPWFWRWIMLVFKMLPERIVMRLKF